MAQRESKGSEVTLVLFILGRDKIFFVSLEEILEITRPPRVLGELDFENQDTRFLANKNIGWLSPCVCV